MGVWIKTNSTAIPTYGKHGVEFTLLLKYNKYYGHYCSRVSEVVHAVWDSVFECFFESNTAQQIADDDIVEWYKEDEDDRT